MIIYAVSSIRLRFLKPVRDGVKEQRNVGDMGDESRTITPGNDSQNFEKMDSGVDHA